MAIATEKELDDAFKKFSEDVQKAAEEVNKKRLKLEGVIEKTKKTIDGQHGMHPDPSGEPAVGQRPEIRDYEKALEDLKDLIENKKNGKYNEKLKMVINGNSHAIRALEVELQHDASPMDWHINAVIVRGLISIDPVANLEPNYSSKSSSSMVT